MDAQQKPLSPVSKDVEELLKARELQYPHLPEPIFVEHILPMLTGDIDFDIDKYLRVAELPQNGINVFTQEGEVLFTVPPLLRDVHFRQSADGTDSIMEILANAENKARITPKIGVTYLRNALDSKIEPRALKDMLDYVDRLNTIFRRYNKPEVVLPADVREAITGLRGTTATDAPDFVPDDYEEL